MVEIKEYTIKPGWISTVRLAALTGIRADSIRRLAHQGKFKFELPAPKLMLIEIESFQEYERRLDELAALGKRRGAPRGPRRVKKTKRK
ncbi:MAG TPA: hypothetical protein VFD70_30850 [Anaerolineae bacterium]|nr:hypothetical protein [Anaerolineae bacterium]